MKGLLFVLLVSFGSLYAQSGNLNKPQLTPTGAVKSYMPGVTVIGNTTTETSLLGVVKDTIKSNTLAPFKPYRFTLASVVTTPTLALLPTLTVRVKLGGTSIAVATSASILGNITAGALIIEGIIISTGTANQVTITEIRQPQGGIITLTSTNSNFVTNTTVDMSVTQALDITAQWGGTLPGSGASVVSKYYYRPDF